VQIGSFLLKHQLKNASILAISFSLRRTLANAAPNTSHADIASHHPCLKSPPLAFCPLARFHGTRALLPDMDITTAKRHDWPRRDTSPASAPANFLASSWPFKLRCLTKHGIADGGALIIEAGAHDGKIACDI